MPADNERSTTPARVGSPDSFLMGGDLQRLYELTSSNYAATNMPRRIEMPDNDPFGLLEIDDTYEKLLGQGFRQAVNLVEAVLPTMGRKTKKDWSDGKRIELPEQSLSDLYSFRMAAQKDKKGECRFISFYRSEDPGVTNRGFTIHKRADGHLVLRDESRGDVDPNDDTSYSDMVRKSIRWIHDYAKQLGYQPDYLKQPVEQQTRRQRAGRFMANQLKAVSNLGKNKSAPKITRMPVKISGTERKKLSPSAKIGRLIAVGAFIPMPAVGSGILQEGFLSRIPKPIALEVMDDMINYSEHDRQGFDAKGLHLPSNGIEVAAMGSGVAVGFDPTLSEELLRAPSIDADSDDLQDVVGGVRKATNLEYGWLENLGGSECEDIKVNLGPTATVKAVTADSAARDKLSVYLDRQQIRICNRTGASMGESQLKSVYLEVTDTRL